MSEDAAHNSLQMSSAVSAFQFQKISGLRPYMQKTCDVAEKAILAKKNLRKKCVNRDKM